MHAKKYPCPSCGSPMVTRHGLKGSFWGCSAYPKCRTALEADLEGRPVQRPDTGVHCDICGSPMVIRPGPRGTFLACSTYPKCRHTKSMATLSYTAAEPLEFRVEIANEMEVKATLLVWPGRARFVTSWGSACNILRITKSTVFSRLRNCVMVVCGSVLCAKDSLHFNQRTGLLRFDLGWPFDEPLAFKLASNGDHVEVLINTWKCEDLINPRSSS